MPRKKCTEYHYCVSATLNDKIGSWVAAFGVWTLKRPFAMIAFIALLTVVGAGYGGAYCVFNEDINDLFTPKNTRQKGHEAMWMGRFNDTLDGLYGILGESSSLVHLADGTGSVSEHILNEGILEEELAAADLNITISFRTKPWLALMLYREDRSSVYDAHSLHVLRTVAEELEWRLPKQPLQPNCTFIHEAHCVTSKYARISLWDMNDYLPEPLGFDTEGLTTELHYPMQLLPSDTLTMEYGPVRTFEMLGLPHGAIDPVTESPALIVQWLKPYNLYNSTAFADEIPKVLEDLSDLTEGYEFAWKSGWDGNGKEMMNGVFSDVKWIAFAIMILVIFCMSFLPYKWLGFWGVICPLLSFCFTFGLVTAFGIHLNPIVGFVPFLILGIGVDDMFVLVRALADKTLRTDTPAKRVYKMFKLGGCAIFITTVTDMMVFFTGWATSPAKAVQDFCIWCCAGVFFDFVYQVALFGTICGLQCQFDWYYFRGGPHPCSIFDWLGCCPREKGQSRKKKNSVAMVDLSVKRADFDDGSNQSSSESLRKMGGELPLQARFAAGNGLIATPGPLVAAAGAGNRPQGSGNRPQGSGKNSKEQDTVVNLDEETEDESLYGPVEESRDRVASLRNDSFRHLPGPDASKGLPAANVLSQEDDMDTSYRETPMQIFRRSVSRRLSSVNSASAAEEKKEQTDLLEAFVRFMIDTPSMMAFAFGFYLFVAITGCAHLQWGGDNSNLTVKGGYNALWYERIREFSEDGYYLSVVIDDPQCPYDDFNTLVDLEIFVREIEEVECIDETMTEFWLRQVLACATTDCIPTCSLPNLISGNLEGCLEDFLMDKLDYWRGKYYNWEWNPRTGLPEATQIFFQVKGGEPYDYSGVECMNAIRDIVDNHAPCHAVEFCQWFTFFEIDESVNKGFFPTFLAALFACTFIAFLLIPSLTIVSLLFVALVLTEFGIIGSISWLGFRVDMFVLLSIVLALGFVTDFSIHLAEGYLWSKAETRRGRTLEAVRTMGGAIILAACSSVLAISIMLIAKVRVVAMFTKFLIVIFTLGIIVTMLFFSFLLSRFGPLGGHHAAKEDE